MKLDNLKKLASVAYCDSGKLLRESIKELEELERLAEIGEATIKAYESGLLIGEHYPEGFTPTICDVEELIEWAEERGGIK